MWWLECSWVAHDSLSVSHGFQECESNIASLGFQGGKLEMPINFFEQTAPLRNEYMPVCFGNLHLRAVRYISNICLFRCYLALVSCGGTSCL